MMIIIMMIVMTIMTILAMKWMEQVTTRWRWKTDCGFSKSNLIRKCNLLFL